MEKRTNKLEARLFRGYWDDGLLDLLAGSGLCLIALAWLADLVALGAMAGALAVFWKPARLRWVEPRLGSVQFTDERVGRQRRHMRGAIVIGVVSFVLAVGLAIGVSAVRVENANLVAALPAALVGLLSAGTGWSLGLGRFHAYAAGLLVGGATVVWFGLDPGWGFLFGGLPACVTGVVRLTRVLRLPIEGAGGRL